MEAIQNTPVSSLFLSEKALAVQRLLHKILGLKNKNQTPRHGLAPKRHRPQNATEKSVSPGFVYGRKLCFPLAPLHCEGLSGEREGARRGMHNTP